MGVALTAGNGLYREVSVPKVDFTSQETRANHESNASVSSYLHNHVLASQQLG